MDYTIQTKSFEDALQWALDNGYTLAEVFGMTSEIEEMLEQAREDAAEGTEDKNDWIVVGDILCRAGDIWDDSQCSTEIYALS